MPIAKFDLFGLKFGLNFRVVDPGNYLIRISKLMYWDRKSWFLEDL